MKPKLREIINNLAKEAVLRSEELLGSGCGQQKKEMAIDYVTEHLPFSGFGRAQFHDIASNGPKSTSLTVPFTKAFTFVV